MSREKDDAERLGLLKALFRPTEEQLEWRAERLQDLALIAEEWRASGTKPDSARGLSTFEFAAVCFAAGHPEALDDALARFLAMDAWLQRWVLEQTRLGHFVGTTLGRD